MHHREALGSADVTDAELTDLVASLMREPSDRVTLLNSQAERVLNSEPGQDQPLLYYYRGLTDAS